MLFTGKDNSVCGEGQHCLLTASCRADVAMLFIHKSCKSAVKEDFGLCTHISPDKRCICSLTSNYVPDDHSITGADVYGNIVTPFHYT